MLQPQFAPSPADFSIGSENEPALAGGPLAGRSSALRPVLRHHRACPGDPSPLKKASHEDGWIRGSSPRMTQYLRMGFLESIAWISGLEAPSNGRPAIAARAIASRSVRPPVPPGSRCRRRDPLASIVAPRRGRAASPAIAPVDPARPTRRTAPMAATTPSAVALRVQQAWKPSRRRRSSRRRTSPARFAKQ